MWTSSTRLLWYFNTGREVPELELDVIEIYVGTTCNFKFSFCKHNLAPPPTPPQRAASKTDQVTQLPTVSGPHRSTQSSAGSVKSFIIADKHLSVVLAPLLFDINYESGRHVRLPSDNGFHPRLVTFFLHFQSLCWRAPRSEGNCSTV